MNEEQKKQEQELISRREYLISMKKWSKAVIGAVVLGGAALGSAKDAGAASWINNRGNWGNGWKNSGGGSAIWVNNRGDGWRNGSGGWRNGSGGWRNGSGGWSDRGGSWRNGSGGSGGWVNRNY